MKFKNSIKFPRISKSSRVLVWEMLKSFGVILCYSPEKVIISCSGGIDSSCLVDAYSKYCFLIDKYPKTIIVYCNHHLREDDELGKELQHVKSITPEWAEFKEIDCWVEKGSGIQEKARKKRYSAINKIADINDIVLMGHTASDVLETCLFEFVSGREVNGIPQERDGICRPFIKFTRKDIETYADVFGIKYCDDSSNSTDKYTRNKIRHHLIPWIKENINPGIEDMYRGRNALED